MRLLMYLAAIALVSCGAAPSLSSPRMPSVPTGFTIERIASVPAARELASTPNGDLIIGTGSTDIYIVPNADSRSPGKPVVFVNMPDRPAAGVALANGTLYIGTQFGVYKVPYVQGDLQPRGAPKKIAPVRNGSIAPFSDGDVHRTTSVAIGGRSQILYVSVGSSCNSCVEIDPTRATIQRVILNSSSMTKRAKRIRNAIALTIDPATGHLWAGNAGQDSLPAGHPYEFLDDVSSHAALADYGWPDCEEHHVAYTAGASCAATVIPLVEFPAYSTLIGDVFYPLQPRGKYTFPARYRGDIFVARHGSWHAPGGCAVAPEVDFVPMKGDRPSTPVNWRNPAVQWKPFVSGFQRGCSPATRIGRPTGITVGPDGSLFIADDQTGSIYRIRPK